MTQSDRSFALKKQEKWTRSVRQSLDGSSVLVAMSGGVDSSVAAYLLAEAGLKVVGIHFRLQTELASATAKGCCHTGSANDVTAVCEKIGAVPQVWNLATEFDQHVIHYFEEAYLQGETPNPCVECNRHLKWGVLWERRRKLGIDWISTGHYARRVHVNGQSRVARGIDHTKDQSYALWPVATERIQRTLLPLGIFTKKEIRIIADEAKLPTANAPESQDICFLSGSDYRDWMKDRYPEVQLAGQIRDTDGRVVATHDNVYGYTVGQRKGIGGGFDSPMYVVRTDPATADVIVGKKEQLLKQELIIRDWIGSLTYSVVRVQVRYRDAGRPAYLTKLADGRVHVQFVSPVTAPATGQSAVAYVGDCVVLGGIIDEIP